MATMQPPVPLSVLHTQVGVNMGDHAQDVVQALDVDPAMSVAALARATLVDRDGTVQVDAYLTVRVASPVEEV